MYILHKDLRIEKVNNKADAISAILYNGALDVFENYNEAENVKNYLDVSIVSFN